MADLHDFVVYCLRDSFVHGVYMQLFVYPADIFADGIDRDTQFCRYHLVAISFHQGTQYFFLPVCKFVVVACGFIVGSKSL